MSTNDKRKRMASIGQDLVQHSKSPGLDARRGLVVELFPFIFRASERLSARAISKYLMDKHGIKLSAVTITKALNDSKKNWHRFFDTVEPDVEIYEKWEKSAKREDFLFDDKAFKQLQFPGREFLRKRLLQYEFAQAIDRLREKWFTIDLETRVKARPYLEERLLGKVK
jgi:hypothetical protein